MLEIYFIYIVLLVQQTTALHNIIGLYSEFTTRCKLAFDEGLACMANF